MPNLEINSPQIEKSGQNVDSTSASSAQPQHAESEPKPKRRPRRQRMNLPFENRKEDAGEWAYAHRIGLSVMVIAYLLLGIIFISSKIVIGRKPHMQGIYVDLQTLAELEAEKERLEREIELKQQLSDLDWSAVRNRISNESMLNENLKDDRNTNTSEINESARDIAASMAANRAAYEAGMAEASSILNERPASESEGDGKNEKVQDSKYKGGVTVRFEFRDPVRTKRSLIVPAYTCEAGGQVVVSVTIDQGGEVVAARVVEGGDDEMRREALKAARGSLFNIDNTAPARQTGTIVYTFIPQ